MYEIYFFHVRGKLFQFLFLALYSSIGLQQNKIKKKWFQQLRNPLTLTQTKQTKEEKQQQIIKKSLTNWLDRQTDRQTKTRTSNCIAETEKSEIMTDR